jgi:threonine synthase
VLPARPESIVSLGEGMTPLLRISRLGARLGADHLYLKDEGLNPTGSFKARGLSAAISMAVELAVRTVAIPSAGNAASALAAYAAAAGIAAHIYMPRDVPQSNHIECRAFGANVTLVDGLISDCARIVRAECAAEGWFDMSTLKEGKKTMGYELAEQMDWQLPDAILYPTGGGVGIIAMWKAFAEMETLGWLGSNESGKKRPRMIAVQVEGCQPVVRAFENGEGRTQFWDHAQTVASGLRVPQPLGDFLILDALRESHGTALAVSDSELLDAGVQLASDQGVFISPEGAACVAAIPRLLASGFLKRSDRIVIYNTGAGLKYLEAYSPRFPRA